jgi:IMP dehydrogenase
MTAKRVRHLPVLADGKVVGVVSIGDLVKASLEEKDFLINQLEHYITGTL